MILSRIALGVAATALIAGAASAHTHHRHHHHHHHGLHRASLTDTPEVGAYSRESAANVNAPPVAPGGTLITNGPVPDTPENRARYGQPMSHGGQATAPLGN